MKQRRLVGKLEALHMSEYSLYPPDAVELGRALGPAPLSEQLPPLPTIYWIIDDLAVEPAGRDIAWSGMPAGYARWT